MDRLLLTVSDAQDFADEPPAESAGASGAVGLMAVVIAVAAFRKILTERRPPQLRRREQFARYAGSPDRNRQSSRTACLWTNSSGAEPRYRTDGLACVGPKTRAFVVSSSCSLFHRIHSPKAPS